MMDPSSRNSLEFLVANPELGGNIASSQLVAFRRGGHRKFCKSAHQSFGAPVADAVERRLGCISYCGPKLYLEDIIVAYAVNPRT